VAWFHDPAVVRREHPPNSVRVPEAAALYPRLKGARGACAEGGAVTRVLIRLDDEVTDELLSAFPQLTVSLRRTQTTLTGDIADQEELQGVLNFLSSLGITIVDVVTIPD
jgi:hypothetical protein